MSWPRQPEAAFRGALRSVVTKASTKEEVTRALSKGLKNMERDFIRERALGVLRHMGHSAAGAAPAIRTLIASNKKSLAKAKPGSIKNGNDQPGGSSYVAIAIMEGALGVKTTRVPYKGYAPTVAALLAGEVQTATVPVPDAIEHHKAGKIRILGVASTQRHFVAPDVRTFKEQGFNVLAGSWRTIVVPKGVPAARVKILEAKLLQTLKDPALVKRANNAGFFVTPMGSKETSDYWVSYDKAVYPVLLSAGLVKTRKK